MMAAKISFGKKYVTYGEELKPFEKADDVGIVITEFLSFRGRPFYPFGSIAQAKVATVRLGLPERTSDDEDDVDLIFRMREADGGHFFEIVRRSSCGTSYGGWLWGQSIEICEEATFGQRVLFANANGRRDRFEFSQRLQRYIAVNELAASRKSRACKRARSSGPLNHGSL